MIKIYDNTTHELVNVLQGHSDTIHEAKFINDSILITCSSDRSLNIYDCKTASLTTSLKQKKEVYSFDIVGDLVALAVGSGVVLVNSKTLKEVRSFNDCHTEDVTRVRFHPNDSTKLLSCSVDGLICIYDLANQDADEAITFVMNGEHSVSTMGFFGPKNMHLWSLSTTERLSVWDLESGTRIKEYGDLRQIVMDKYQVEVNYFNTCHYDANDNTLYLFGGDFTGNGLVFRVEADNVVPIAKLAGGHTEIIRSTILNKDKQEILTAGEDNKLCFWTNSAKLVASDPSPKSQSSSKIVVSVNE
ncbi:hypothetical protein SAMD00019534_065500 [Acytostelium subglobosum LB1]|uniref:hypothetical protein n=1 Tax=Acytostelium subglobosum LB1 TaxID=1410327 RepID=UPI000644801F|nr:hypothetical protein SAMD00019534_065500 [Acytostelium subglobosum LB1]GAM23375.1 hypothetical protein SAMD00019534_065500 [Acytostelium subglobosum LB1]|eukprot:XP_012753824.1 hypothetical protein SAMD00019534_065500 [Acytostelium subglobosum LB1]